MDFQLSRYTSPTIDLIRFCDSSMSDDVWHNHKDEVIKEYHSNLCYFMQKIGCKTKPPSLEKLHQYLKKRAVFGMMTSLLFLPFVLIEEANAISLNELVKEKDEGLNCGRKLNPGFYNPRYRKIIIKRLEMYDKMGVLDYPQ